MKATGGLTRGEAVQRAAAGSGVLAAGMLLSPPTQAVAEAAEEKDEAEQFGELRGELERKGKEEEASWVHWYILVAAMYPMYESRCYGGSRCYRALELTAKGRVVDMIMSPRGRRWCGGRVGRVASSTSTDVGSW